MEILLYPNPLHRLKYEASQVDKMRISVHNGKCLMWVPNARAEYINSLEKWEFICAVMYAKGKVYVDKEVFTTFPNLQKVLASKEALLEAVTRSRREYNQWMNELMDELRDEIKRGE